MNPFKNPQTFVHLSLCVLFISSSKMTLVLEKHTPPVFVLYSHTLPVLLTHGVWVFQNTLSNSLQPHLGVLNSVQFLH